jgi:Rrf2 family nitric oxide-sensitive transcriptional repressor
MLVECFDAGNHCALTGHCRLAGAVSGALAAFLAHLEAHTLADLLRPPRPPGRARVVGPKRSSGPTA